MHGIKDIWMVPQVYLAHYQVNCGGEKIYYDRFFCICFAKKFLYEVESKDASNGKNIATGNVKAKEHHLFGDKKI